MDEAVFSALAGTLVGGLSTFATTWITQVSQGRVARRAEEHARRQDLYGRFVDELANLHAHALSEDRVDYHRLTSIFALKGRILLFAPPAVVAACEASVGYVIDLYLAPCAPPEELRALLEPGRPDWIKEFARAASADLHGFRGI